MAWLRLRACAELRNCVAALVCVCVCVCVCEGLCGGMAARSGICRCANACKSGTQAVRHCTSQGLSRCAAAEAAGEHQDKMLQHWKLQVSIKMES